MMSLFIRVIGMFRKTVCGVTVYTEIHQKPDPVLFDFQYVIWKE